MERYSDSVNDGITNVAFLRTRVEFIEYCFEEMKLMKFGLHRCSNQRKEQKID